MEAFLLSVVLLILNPTPQLVVWDEVKAPNWKWNGEYTWTVVHNPEWMEGLCQMQEVMPIQACAKRMSDGSCDIYSPYPEWLAKLSWSYSFESLWTHEMKHCEGYRHRSIFAEAEK